MSLNAVCIIGIAGCLAYIAVQPGSPVTTLGDPGCDASQNHGTDTYFDDIRITGSREFVSATVDALQRLWYTPSYRRYVKALHAIREASRGPRGALAWTHRDGVMWAWGSTARRSCNLYARTITHEGAHNVGIGHGPGMTAVEHAVLRELQASTQVAERR